MKKKKVVLVIVATIAVIFLAYESVMHMSYMRRRRNGLCSVQEMLGWLYRLS